MRKVSYRVLSCVATVVVCVALAACSRSSAPDGGPAPGPPGFRGGRGGGGPALTPPPPPDVDPVEEVAGAGLPVYRLAPEGTEARFRINEVLRGNPFTVVGTTGRVHGALALDLEDPAAAQVSTLWISAGELTTDDERRNGALRRRILAAGEHPWITFKAADISGLPATLAPEETVSFQVTGDLTIRGATRPAAFQVEMTPLGGGELKGIARATIRYADFGVSIPQVPFVASVEEEVGLELEFTAVADQAGP